MQLNFSKKRFASRLVLGLTLALAIGACQQNGGSSDSPLPDDPTNEVYDPSLSKPGADAIGTVFKEPTYTSSEITNVLSQYQYLDPGHVIDTKLLAKAVLYFHYNKAHFGNTSVMTVIDYSLHSSKSRFYIVDMATGAVWSTHVAHGKNSDTNNDGYADAFSNMPNSEMTSLGAYVTGETYSGNYGYSMRLDGVSLTNSNARARAIVLHGAYYVVAAERQPGRSWGCPAVPITQRTEIIDRLKGGSLIYAGASKLLTSPTPSPTPVPTATPAPTATPKPSATPAATPIATPAPTPAPTATPKPSATPLVAALWETSSYAAGKGQLWSAYAYNIVAASPNLLAGPSDVTNFCPAYRSLTTAQKTSFWVYFVSGVTKYESGQNPLSRMKEALGTDPITGLQVESEGLLQLSYQDKLNYPFCNEFDWSVDKSLSPTDPKKTILDPYKNLACGIRIMNKIFGSHNAIAFKSGNYWSTLMTGGNYSKVPQIQALTSALPFCK